jgi:N-acetylglutamate synthase
MTIDLAQVAVLESTLLHVWPAVETHRVGDWVVRLANGYSGRSNSASALSPETRRC